MRIPRRLPIVVCALFPVSGVQAQTEPPSTDDPRDNFEASAYTGLAVDTFAASDLRRYGLDFDLDHLFKKSASDK